MVAINSKKYQYRISKILHRRFSSSVTFDSRSFKFLTSSFCVLTGPLLNIFRNGVEVRRVLVAIIVKFVCYCRHEQRYVDYLCQGAVSKQT